MGIDTNAHLLDNVAWYSLTGPRRSHAERQGRAARFDPEVAPFAAVDDHAEPPAWDDLLELVGPGRRVVLIAPDVTAPAGWVEEIRIPLFQLVADEVDTSGAADGLLELGAADVPEMLELIAATQPGPFEPRTVELGGYVGVRDDDGRLVAMAGERLRVDGYSEVSAVCTVPELRGTGLGTKLVLAVVAAIRARGEEAFLHVAATNTNALRLYLALGFTERIKADAIILKAPA